MPRQSIFDMSFQKVYPLLITKAEKKGCTKEEVYEVTSWLTGYTKEEIEEALNSDITYGDFFRNLPKLNENASLIKGVICKIRVEEIEDPLMRNIRYLDKLVDELAKGKSMEKIKRIQ
ncbi:MAG: DUF2200 domain-containing protein [Eubacteriales bacterium]|nr:DUF2200 domain-containing protein [Eubacteriales bacterium]